MVQIPRHSCMQLSIFSRYQLSGHTMTLLRDWMMATVGISLEHRTPPQVCMGPLLFIYKNSQKLLFLCKIFVLRKVVGFQCLPLQLFHLWIQCHQYIQYLFTVQWAHGYQSSYEKYCHKFSRYFGLTRRMTCKFLVSYNS